MSVKNRRVKAFLFCLYCFAVVATSAWASSRLTSPMQTELNIVQYRATPGQPIELTGFTVAGKDLKFNENFVGGKEWLRSLSFSLKNTYNKPITYVTLHIEFPETRDTGEMMMFPLRYGKNKRFSLKIEESEEFLLPNSEANMRFSVNTYVRLKNFLETRQEITSLHKILVSVAEVQFADNTYWAGGSWFQIDPGDSRKSIRLSN